DVLLLGLDGAAPSCAVSFTIACRVLGVGVDPTCPPLVWEAWDGTGWAGCEVERDGTGGFNQAGSVVVHLPATHQESSMASVRAGWVRCRVVRPPEGFPSYSASPVVSAVTADVVGGTVGAVHAESRHDEVL